MKYQRDIHIQERIPVITVGKSNCN